MKSFDSELIKRLRWGSARGVVGGSARGVVGGQLAAHSRGRRQHAHEVVSKDVRDVSESPEKNNEVIWMIKK